jgi:host factor-I protein
MLQDQFLKNMVQTRVPVTIYLMNGIRLLGEVESFDQYGLVLGGTTQQFVYKHAISTNVPTREIAVRAAAPAERKEAAPVAQKDAAPAAPQTAAQAAPKDAAPAAPPAEPKEVPRAAQTDVQKDAAPAEQKDAAPRKTTTLRARTKRS